MVIFFLVGRRKKQCGLNNGTIDYCIEFQLPYGIITILYVSNKAKMFTDGLLCTMHNWNREMRWGEV